MDTVSIVSITTGGIFLLCIPLLATYFGVSLRGKAADEAEKRYLAEKELQERLLTEAKATIAQKENALKQMDIEIKSILSGVTQNAGAIHDRQEILAGGDSPDDAALKLLHRKAADSSGAGSPHTTNPT